MTQLIRLPLTQLQKGGKPWSKFFEKHDRIMMQCYKACCKLLPVQLIDNSYEKVVHFALSYFVCMIYYRKITYNFGSWVILFLFLKKTKQDINMGHSTL